MRQQSLAHDGQSQRFSRNRLSRGRGLRKTTGCLTCRRRRVKCDEAKPICKACARTDNECMWPPAHSFLEREHRPAQSSDSIGSDATNATTRNAMDFGAETRGMPNTRRHIPSGSHSPSHHGHSMSPGSGRTQAVDEAAAALVGFRDGWHHGVPTSDPQSSIEAEHAVAPGAQHQSSPSITGQSFGIASSTSLASTLHGFNTSPVLSPLSTNAGEWVHSDARQLQESNIKDATHVWANLLLKDASSRTEPGTDMTFPSHYIDDDGLAMATGMPPLSPQPRTPAASVENGRSSASYARCSPASHLETNQLPEDEAWRSPTPLELEPHEYTLFHDFIQNLSQWMDFFDPKRPFGTLVPHLAVRTLPIRPIVPAFDLKAYDYHMIRMRNTGLMNAILALSVRHLSLNVRFQAKNAQPQDPLDALPFYFTTLHYIQEAMQYDTYKNSLEFLATASIVSAYEMLDGSRQDWERHLRGLSWIQQSQGIHGDSGGLKQAVWWTWLCQDVWAAWRERRKPFMTWQPDRSLSQLDNFEVAARSVYLFGQTTGFCSKDEVEMGRHNPAARLAKAKALQQALRDWHEHLPEEFEPLPVSKENRTKEPFQPIWINPPCFAIAVQLFHCSQVLILANSPCLGGMEDFKKQQAQLNEHVRAICSIAVHLKSDPASVMCSQTLFIAGSFVHEQSQRDAVIGMLDGCWRRAGWPLQSLSVELQHEWNVQKK